MTEPTHSAFHNHFREVQVNFSKLYAAVLGRANLTLPQYALLNQLAVTGLAPMTDLSKHLRISKPAVTHLADRLEEAGYLKRIVHPKDRRSFLLKLKPKGARLVQKTQRYVFRILLKTLETFGVRERETIDQFYTALSKTIASALVHSKALRND